MKKFAKRAKYAVALAIAGVMSLSVCPVGAFAEGDDVNVTLKNYYTSDYDNYDDLLADGDKLEQEVYGEGIVVMKNEDNVLPLAQGSNITVFGKNSNTNNIRASLEVAGYNVNPTLKSFYASSTLSGKGRSAYDAPGNGDTVPGYLTGETPVSMYRETEINSFADYSDAAVVILYRMAGEGNDSARTMMWDGTQFKTWNENSTQLVPGARNKDDHYLQLDQNETDMLALAAEHFDDVIVIMQTPSSFETGFLDDPGHYAYQENIKGAIYIGMPYSQVSGTDVLGKVMQGRINPSGRLVDTWARDFKLDPTWQNFGNQLSEYGDTKGNAYPNVAYGAGSRKGSYYNNYVTYNEGIYVGYRYWETRGYTAGTGEYVTDGSAAKPHVHGTSTTTWDNWYQAHVVYPYGHGLSYTTFTQEIVETIPANGLDITATDNITIKVKVTNTGSVAGKEVVQIYHTSPYKAGGIEKSHVLLSAFDKTDLLQPGESQTLTLTFSARDMASYDYSDANNNGFKGYELEDGTYTIRLGKDAHNEWAHVDFVVDSTETLRKDPVTGNDIVNQFDEVSSYITDPESLGGLNQKYLSRNDWVGTWPVQNIRLTGSQRVIDGVNDWAYNATRDPARDQEEELYTTVMPTTGAKKGIKLAELNRKDWDDPLWKDYVEQFTYDQLVTLVTRGSYYSGFNDKELGLVKSGNYDTRGGLYAKHSSMKNSRIGDIIILAQTFNEDLAYQMGLQVGEEALWCEASADGDIAGSCAWYAPSVNIHRSQFLGRNQQYYGEDALLAGKLAARMVVGAQSKGFATYVKHFAVNNQETNRIGLSTWLNEQAMREIYFKAFEITVKEGKTMGIMSALNRIGTTWAGGDDGLLNKVLRDEWGFRGAVVTDSFIGNFSNADQMIRGGGDLCLGSGTIAYNVKTPTTTAYLQNAAHNILYMMANTNAVNAYPQGNHKPVDTFVGTVLNTAIVDVSYSASVATATVSDVLFPDVDDSVITYKLSDGGKLPAGLTLSADGTLSGIPTEEANNFRISVDASYAGYTKTAVFTLSIAGGAGSIIYQAEPELGVIAINTPAYISVKGASIFKKDATPEEIAAFPAITYSLKTGSALPSGLSLLETGDIIGQPDKECTDYEFTVLANAPGFRSVELTFNVSVHYGMTFGGGTLANGKVGDSYVQRINLATCEKPVTYSLAPGSTLPAGLVLTAGGYITGIPTESVTNFKFSVVAKADFAQPVTAEYTLSIGLSYGNLALPNATKGGEYLAYVNTAQGDFSATYSLKAGSRLPAGLTLAPTGEITGTPTEAGVFEITFVVSANGKIGDEITTTLYVAGTNPVAPEGTWTGDQVTSLALGLGLGLGIPLVASIAVLVWLLIKFIKGGGNFGGGNDGGTPNGNGGGNDGGTPNGNGGGDTPKKQMSEPNQTATYMQYDTSATRAAIKVRAQTKPLVVFSSIFTSLFAILLAITIVLTSNEFLFNTICNVIGKGEAYIVSGSETDNDFEYYKLDDGFEKKADVLAAAYELNEDICEEGFVLLKNQSGALPIAKQTKVTVFGKNSVDMVLGGSGSNAGSSVGATTLYDSLTQAGIEYNPTIKTFYESTASGSGRPAPLAMGSILTGWPTGETAISAYPANVKNSYTNYNDAALVVITRVGGEGFDLPRTMFYNNSKSNNQEKFTDWDGSDLIPGAKSKDAHYLELDKNEEDMLAEACANFDKVIVIINSASTMELGFVQDNANIDAALWIGAPGYSGLAALGRILTGEVTPSGATVDTHARDFTKDPTWYNFGNNMQKNGNMYPGFASGREAYYVEYLEGIYSGYRYYETRAKEAQGTWYDENVIYPFGFGLSYTQFEYTVSHDNATELSKDGKLTFTVEVKNVGTEFDGKDAIQLYYSAPYTAGKIEKAHVNLGAFAKTKTIAKNNGTDTVTLEIDVRDMASYDYDDANANGFKGYELDAGEYTIYITDSADGAHCWADNNANKFTFTVPTGGFKYDGTGDAKNLFDDVSGHIDEYLSRENNFANFSVLAKGFTDHKTASSDFISAFNALNKKGAVEDKTSDPWYVSTMPKQSGKELNSSQTDVKLYDLIGKDYNDPTWDKLLDQITVKQMVTLVSTGNFHTAAIEGIDKPETTDADGPMGFAMFMSVVDPVVYGTCYYACEVVLASTFNAQLAYDMGRMVGNEGLAGNEKGDGIPYSGWYAPAMNIHRSQFGGRNFEYYSEDGFISGVMGSNVIKGANAKGVYTYCKHFVLNDQETNRDDTGLVTWANEQAMREIYFEPFEMAVKDGGTTAMMSSFNRIGITWAGGSYALLTELLRNEWGFEGMVITDYNLKAYMNTDWMIRAGGDLSLSAGGKNPARTTTATDVASLRKATKNILYTVANSCAMNGHGPGIVWGYTLPWWVTTLIVADCVVFVAAGALWTLYALKKSKLTKAEVNANEN